jgi:hypothetical protein
VKPNETHENKTENENMENKYLIEKQTETHNGTK